jgi:hypothetical protein
MIIDAIVTMLGTGLTFAAFTWVLETCSLMQGPKKEAFR